MLNSKTEILDYGAEYEIKKYLLYDYQRGDKERVQKKD